MVFAKKSLGQNFLMHPQTAERIVEAAGFPPDATVLEIGPGTGMLTRALLARAKKVVAVETDDMLAPELLETFSQEVGEGRLEIIHADIREFDPISLGNTYHLVANIPYYITGEIIRTFLTAENKPASMTLLVQKEVAERIARNNGKESLLSLSVEAYGEPKYCFTVPRGAFRPAPSVDSAVLSIQNIKKDTFASPEAEEFFFSVLRAGFAHKRKRLAKNLEVLASASAIKDSMEVAKIDTNARPEDVPIATWQELVRAISSKRESVEK